MKELCKKHTVIFFICIIVVALSGNLFIGFMQSFFTNYGVAYYLSEAVYKYGISVVGLYIMVKWGYTGKSNFKKIMTGFAWGCLVILFMAPNLIPLVLINPILFQLQWARLIALILAMFSIGLSEEVMIRGVLLPLLCEKWKEKKHPYVRAALVSSLLFACLHLSWSVRCFLAYRSLPWDFLSGNLYQVYFTFCFGILAAGICMYCRSLWPLVFWHGLGDLSAYLMYGILPFKTLENYAVSGGLTLQNVFDTYGIFPGCSFGAEIVHTFINLLFLLVGVYLVRKAEKEWISNC